MINAVYNMIILHILRYWLHTNFWHPLQSVIISHMDKYVIRSVIVLYLITLAICCYFLIAFAVILAYIVRLLSDCVCTKQ